MVVATQKNCRHTPLTSARSEDSLARSLHKDVDYPAINVTRRSPDERPSPLAPDCKYPSPALLSGQRKRPNAVVDTGWHACFKNNNYVFVRNEGVSDGQFEERWKDSNNADVTFVISTTKPVGDGQEEKLIVSLQDPKTTIKRSAPLSPSEPPPEQLPATAPESTKLEIKRDNSSGRRSKRSDKKKTSGWLKKLTPRRGKLLKVEGTEEETTPIYESSPDDSPDSLEAPLSPPVKESKKIPSPGPLCEETPMGDVSFIGKGPHTSTPKHKMDAENMYQNLPDGPTPQRPCETRMSVRRRLPYGETPEEQSEAEFMQRLLFPNGQPAPPKMSQEINGSFEIDISPLERRISCHKQIMASPKFETSLHPAIDDNIPYADDMEDVSFDDKPRPRLVKALPERQNNRMSYNPFLQAPGANSEEMLSSMPDMRSPRDASLALEVKPISKSEPTLRVQRASSCRVVDKAMSPMEEEENRSLEWHGKSLVIPDDSTVTFSPYSPRKTFSKDNPVACWLKELRFLTETECLNALQAKELIKEDWITNALAVGNAQEAAERIWEAGSAVGKNIAEMTESLKKPTLSSTPFSLKVAQFCSSVVNLLKMGTSQQISQVETRIKRSCSELLDTINKGQDKEDWKKKMVAELEIVQQSVQIIVQQFLLRHLHVIVECVEKASNINCLKRAVFALILLGRLDTTFCELVAKLGAARSLLALCVEKKWTHMHPCALRALTVLSSVPEAIRSIEESGGVDCVCDVLCDSSSAEAACSEAAGLIAQITAPWTEGSGYVLRSITQNAERLVRSIAALASKTESSEVFLLSSAALANLSFSEDALKRMKENRVLEILVNACRNSPHAASLFIKDQVATVLANMASKEEYKDALSSGGSLVLLLCFLQLRPSVGHGPPQLSACERIQQKAAIALARLCTNPDTSNIVADMQGIQRLVKLCKDRKERNDSDSVLVACLAALRKIAAVRQKEEFRKLGAQELVEPRLWDAFLAHSSKRESYV